MIAEAIMCLAMNIYHEARDQDLIGQMAVAEVTMNRVKSKKYPNDVCKVVWQRKQFSWTKDGKSDRMYEEHARLMAMEIAEIYVTGKVKSNLTHGATHYHANWVNPPWAKKLKKVRTIGTHIFYR